MGKEIEIPSDYRYTFQRLMRITPETYRQDPEFVKEMLAFIKIGGEKLARKNLEAYLTPFQKEFVFRRRVPSDEDVSDDEEDSGDETSDDPEDDGDDMDEDDDL